MAPPKGKPFPGTRVTLGRQAGAASSWHLANVAGWSAMSKQARSTWNTANWRKSPKGREQAAANGFIQRFHKHGLTLDQYHSLAEKQDFLCAICKNETKPRTRKDNRNHYDGFVIDHNHETGKVRGLLCCNCNVGIGMLRDSPEVLMNAASYLVN